MKGVQITTSQLGLSAVIASLISFASAIPSCRFMFIFQLPATIFFLIVVFFIKISVRIDCYCRFLNFKYLVHAHIRSASVSKKSGSRKISIIFMTLLAVELSGCRPISNWAKGLSVIVSRGRLLWLHLPMMRPSFIKRRPGLLRTMVLSVVSSVVAKGYWAPVLSLQVCMLPSVLAVRQ